MRLLCCFLLSLNGQIETAGARDAAQPLGPSLINYSGPFAFESVSDTPPGRQELVQRLGEHQGVRAPAESQVQTPVHLLSACH